MDTVEIGGKQYVKAREAAKKAGYTADYVGQLCRSGAIDAHLVGRSWYVDVDELAAHRVQAKRNSRVKARAQVKKTLEEQKQQEEKADGMKYLSHSAAVAYSADERELLPTVTEDTVHHEEEDIPDTREEEQSEIPIRKVTARPAHNNVVSKPSAEESPVTAAVPPIPIEKQQKAIPVVDPVDQGTVYVSRNAWSFMLPVFGLAVIIAVLFTFTESVWVIEVGENTSGNTELLSSLRYAFGLP